jgi:hypothetical protein
MLNPLLRAGRPTDSGQVVTNSIGMKLKLIPAREFEMRVG